MASVLNPSLTLGVLALLATACAPYEGKGEGYCSSYSTDCEKDKDKEWFDKFYGRSNGKKGEDE